MQTIRIWFLAMLLLLLASLQVAAASELTIAAGAGYKRMVAELCLAFTDKSGIEVQQIFGNMGQVTAQARESGMVDIVVGDKRFLDAAGLEYAGEMAIGEGILIAAVAKGVELASLSSLGDSQVHRIALPDANKAIYGRAASEFLSRSRLRDRVAEKLLMVGTVPQVSAYVVSGEVDVGFINLTEAQVISDKVEQCLTVDPALYDPILIVGKVLGRSKNHRSVAAYQAFLLTPDARTIIRKHGL